VKLGRHARLEDRELEREIAVFEQPAVMRASLEGGSRFHGGFVHAATASEHATDHRDDDK